MRLSGTPGQGRFSIKRGRIARAEGSLAQSAHVGTVCPPSMKYCSPPTSIGRAVGFDLHKVQQQATPVCQRRAMLGPDPCILRPCVAHMCSANSSSQCFKMSSATISDCSFVNKCAATSCSQYSQHVLCYLLFAVSLNHALLPSVCNVANMCSATSCSQVPVGGSLTPLLTRTRALMEGPEASGEGSLGGRCWSSGHSPSWRGCTARRQKHGTRTRSARQR